MELGRRDVERIVEEQVEAFEEALLGKVDLGEPRLKTILLALDRSNQDDMVMGLGSELSRRYSAALVVTGGFPDDLEEEARSYLSEAIRRLLKERVDATALWAPGEESFEKILWARQESEADMLVLPAPYFRDIESLGEDSVGTNLDVLLARSQVPLLVVRDPGLDPAAVLAHIHLAIFDDSLLSKGAAEWALLLAKGGRMDALALVEEEFVGMVEEALAPEAISDEDIGKRFARDLVPLVSAVLRRCDEAGIPWDVEYATGDLVNTITKRVERRQGLIVLRGYEPHDRPGEKVAREVILRSRSPVMAVKGGG
ncbi:MAG: hypothetical protein ACE5HJ_03890 [Thermoplasmata archaeon]